MPHLLEKYGKIPAMKRRMNTLVALFFIIATLTTSLHEMLPHHDSGECQVCTLVQHDNAVAPDESIKLVQPSSYFEAIPSPAAAVTPSPTSILKARAPPLFS